MNDSQLSNFLLSSAQNIRDSVHINSVIYKYIKELDNHWFLLLFPNSRHKDKQSVSTLITNAHYFFRSSISLILAGQCTPIYSLLRTSLESCLYATMISLNPELENIWIDRHKDEAHKEACRNKFTASKIFKFLSTINEPLSKDCRQIYDTYIDYGAHPNIYGTFTFVEPSFNGDDNSVLINYLQGDNREARIAAFTAVQLAEMALHLAIYAMPTRTVECGTKKFLSEFSPKINLQIFGL